jgi:hypothetical protein
MGELIVVFLIIAVAAFFTVRALIRTLSGWSDMGCGSCPGGTCSKAGQCPSACECAPDRTPDE